MISKIALRYAFSRKNRHRSTSIRIAIGLVFCTLALNVIIAFMLSLQDQRFAKIISYQSYDATIETDNEQTLDTLYNELKSNDKIHQVFFFNDLPCIIKKNDTSNFVTIRAFDKESLSSLDYSLIGGTFEDEGVLISYNQAIDDYYKIGEEIELNILKTGKTVPVVPSKIKLNISGIYYTPLYQFNENYIILSRDTLLKRASNTPTKIGVFGDLDTIKHIVGDKATLTTWKMSSESLYAAMKLEQYMMYLTLSLMSLIVLINLLGSTKNLINYKRNEIVMLRVMGVKKIKIIQIFIYQALIISFVGTALGSFLSFILLSNASSIMNFINKITNYSIALLSIPLSVGFSLSYCLSISIPILIFTFISSYISCKSLLKNDGMEILLNE